MTALIEKYLDYVQETESPVQYHRWALLSAIAANLGRNIYFNWGHVGKIYPNMYCLLIGSPGTRKDSALRSAKDILTASGFEHWTDSTASYEQFLEDFADGFSNLLTTKEEKLVALKQSVADVVLSDAFSFDKLALSFNKVLDEDSNQAYIIAGEFANFIGENNKRFTTGLTALWDNPSQYGERSKSRRAKQVVIINPVVNLIGGMTPSSFNTYIPQEIKDAGFTARVNLIYSDRAPQRITFPPMPDETIRQELIAAFKEMKQLCGEIQLSKRAADLLDAIYKTDTPPKDIRLHYYHDRRLVHLIKLVLILAASDLCLEATENHIIEANTILSYTELFMPKALGEYGFSKISLATQKVMETLLAANGPLSVQQIMASVGSDIETMRSLSDILLNLKSSGKIEESKVSTNQEIYYLACKVVTGFKGKFAVDTSYIREYSDEL